MASKFGLAGGIPERRVRPVWDAIDSRQFKNALKLSTALLAKFPNSPYALVRTFPLRFFSCLEGIFFKHFEPFLAFVSIFLSCIFSRTKRRRMEYKKLPYLRGVQCTLVMQVFFRIGWSWLAMWIIVCSHKKFCSQCPFGGFINVWIYFHRLNDRALHFVYISFMLFLLFWLRSNLYFNIKDTVCFDKCNSGVLKTGYGAYSR